MTSTLALRIGLAWVHANSSVRRRLDSTSRLCGDRGEGVISAAIAVLIVAFLGALMWVAFKGIWEDTEATTREQVGQIGS